MWLARYLAPVHLLVCSLALTSAGSSWGFNDATISIQGKGSGVGAGFKERYRITVARSILVSR